MVTTLVKPAINVAAAVAKILDYESVPLENLNRKVLLVADDDELAFETLQEDLVNLYLAQTRLPVERAYLKQLGVSATRDKIRDEIDDGSPTTRGEMPTVGE